MRRWTRVVAVVLAIATLVCPWLQFAGLMDPKLGAADDAKESCLLASEQATLDGQSRGVALRGGTPIAPVALPSIAPRWPCLDTRYDREPEHSYPAIPLFILQHHLTI